MITKHKQYTIRNVPEPVDQYLRKQSQISGRSLNQTIIDELAEKAGVSTDDLSQSLSWFVGSGIDDQTLQVLSEEDAIQKQLAQKELDNAA